MTGQALEIAIPMEGDKVVAAVLLVPAFADDSRALCDKILQPHQTIGMAGTSRQSDLDAQLAQRNEVVDVDLGRCLGVEVASSVFP